MEKKISRNSRKNSNKPNSQARRRKQQSRQQGHIQVSGAPAGVSSNVQQFTRFLPATSGGLRMHTCAAMASLGNDQTGTGKYTLQPASSTSTLYGACKLNLTKPVWGVDTPTFTAKPFLSPVFDLIGSAFVRYKVHKCMFHYAPQSPSTREGRIVFAFAEDPDHPLLMAATMTSDKLLALSDSIAFAPWAPWSMDVSKTIQQNLLYTWDDDSQTYGDRFSYFGGIGCMSSAPSIETPAIVLYGVVYIELDIELMEFCPVSATLPGIVDRLSKLYLAGTASESDAEERACETTSTTPSKERKEDQLTRGSSSGRRY